MRQRIVPQNLDDSALNKPAVSSRLISEASLNDKQLQRLHAKRVEIYSLATPTVILGKNGKAETIWIDETNHPLKRQMQG